MKLNDAPTLSQLDGQWQKIVALVLNKLGKPGETVVITTDDMKRFSESSAYILSCIGSYDTITLKLVTEEEAKRLAEHDRRNQGNA